MTAKFFPSTLRSFTSVGLLLSGLAFAVCDDDGKDDTGNLRANVSNSACVNGTVKATLGDGGGGGVNTTPPTGIPPVGLTRAVSGTGTNTFTNGASLNAPITPGQVYNVDWTKIGSSTTASLHTLIEPENLPKGYKVQINTGNGAGWTNGTQLDLAATSLDVTTVDEAFRIVRPIREPGKVGDIMLVKSVLSVQRGTTGSETRTGVSGVDANVDTIADQDVPTARFIMPLGAALEAGRPITAGDLVLNCPLWRTSTFNVTRDWIAYEGVDRTATGVQVITDSGSRIRQVLAPEIFVDLVTITSDKFEIRLYSPDAVFGQTPSPFYTPTGNPYSVWTLQTLASSDFGGFFTYAKGIRVSETKEGVIVREVDMSASHDDVNVYKTRRAEGAEIEFVISSVVPLTTLTSESIGGQSVGIGAGSGLTQCRTETVLVTRDGAPVKNTVERFVLADGGMGEGILDRAQTHTTGQAPLVTQFWHIWNQSYAVNYSSPMGRPYFEYYPDGSWERYKYLFNGKVSKIFRPYEGVPTRPWDASDTAGGVVENYSYAYDPVTTAGFYSGAPDAFVSMAETLEAAKETKIAGKTVAKTTRMYTAATLGGQPVLQTTIRTYRDATHYDESVEEHYHETAVGVPAGMPISRTSALGAKESYSYERGTFDPSARTFTLSSSGLHQRMTKTEGTAASPAGLAYRTTRVQTIRNAAGTTLQETTQIYTGSGYETATVTDYFYDASRRLIEIRQDGRIKQSIVYNGLQKTITDEAGASTTVTMDLNGRITTDAKASGPTATTSYSGSTMTTVVAGAGGLSLTGSKTHDMLGRPISDTDNQGRVFNYSYPNSGRDFQTTFPGAKTRIETRQTGGRLLSISGTKVIPRFYSYVVNTNGTRVGTESMVTSGNVRYTKTTTDWRGNEIIRETPAPTGTGTLLVNQEYQGGVLVKETVGGGAGLAPWIYAYNALGEVFRQGRDFNGNGILDPASSDPVTEYDRRYEKIGSDWYGVREILQYQQNGSTTPTSVDLIMSRMSGLSGGTAGQVIAVNANGVKTISSLTINRGTKTSTTVTSRSDRTETSTQISVNGLMVSRAVTGQTAETFQYDGLERLWKSADSRTGATTTRTYSGTTGLLASVTEDALGRTTSYNYHASNVVNAGMLKEIVNPDGKSTYQSYNDRGQLIRTWGAAAHPEEITYNTYGDVSQTTSFRAGTGWTASTWPTGTTGSGDTTTINYFPATGLIKERIDPAAEKVQYTWKNNGNLNSRTWARGVITTYSYDQSGNETLRHYSDASIQDIVTTRDRAGRVGTLADASGVRTLSYAPGGMLNSVSVGGSGLLSGYVTSFPRDTLGRPVGTTITQGANSLFAETRTYEASSARLDKVISGNQEADYMYVPNSNLVRGIIWRTGGDAVLGQNRDFDSVDRITSVRHVSNNFAGGPKTIDSENYTYDLLNHRETTTYADGTFWTYDYSDRGELTLADKKVAGGASYVPGQQFRTTFDNSGNRSTKESGGDAVGSGRRTFASTYNALNQRITQTTPSTLDVIGSSDQPVVTVNSTTATRQGDYFRAELTASNSSAPAWTAVSIASGIDTQTGYVLTPRASVVPTYDKDGNLTNDGLWAYTWDAENRLTKAVRNLSGIPYREIRFSWDGFNRLIQKQVYHALGGSVVSTEKYVYEANRRLLTVNASDQVVQSFHWGLDISGGQDGAGGAGGLLWITDAATSVTHVACTDANANVTRLMNAATGAVTASYEYSPHGELLRMTGSYATANPFRFSTKAQDDLTGLVYYGRRFYKPDWGTWLSRDPMGDVDGLNRYGFCGGDPINHYDVNGTMSQGDQAYWAEMLNPLSWLGTAGECAVDPNYYNQVGHNYKKFGEGFYRAGEGAVDGIRNLPEIADFIASGKAAEMMERLMNDPDFRDAMADKLGNEFCEWLKHATTNDGAFELLGEQAFNALSGAALKKLLDALKEVELLGKFAKKIPEKLKAPEKLLCDGGCFVAGTPVLTAAGPQAIETLGVGQRVLTSDQEDETSGTAVDPETWRQLTLKLQNPDSPSTWFDVVTLRPVAWIEAHGAKPGSVIGFKLEEMGIEGPAEIVSIDACPKIASGPGRVVFSTVSHTNGDLRILHLADNKDPIELTGSHRLFSLDRGDWIVSRNLYPGEVLKTRNGPVTVASIESKPGEHRVFNIEVETEHCFFVGSRALLSHNATPCLTDNALVIRGGGNTAENFTTGSGVITDSKGLLNEVSVNSVDGKTLEQLSEGIPHNQVGSTTVGEVRAAGGDVVPSPTERNPNHATLSGIDAETASRLMQPTVPNPTKKR